MSKRITAARGPGKRQIPALPSLRLFRSKRASGGRAAARHRGGITYLELQVAMVLLAAGLTGLAPLAVINTRQAAVLRDRLPPDETHYLDASDGWAAKLGVPADLVESPPVVAPVVDVIDDGDTFYFDYPDWHGESWSGSFQGDDRYSYYGDGTDQAWWIFSNLQPGQYEVLVTYSAWYEWADDAPFTVFDDTVYRDLVRVNQKIPPSGPSNYGRNWVSLGTHLIVSGTLRVRLTDYVPSGYVCADGVWIRPVRNRLLLKTTTPAPDGDSIEVEVGVETP